MPEESPGVPPGPPSRPGVGLPPPPLATEAVVGVRDVPLPWTTPLATLGAGVVGGALLAASLHYTHVTTRAPGVDAVLDGSVLLWWTGVIGAGAAAVDRLAPRWSAPGRWALGMGAAAVPNPAILALALVESGSPPWGVVLLICLVAGALFAVLGAGLGLARRSSEGLWWRLPLAGALVMAALPGGLVGAGVAVQAFMGGPTSLPGPVPVQIVVLAGVLGLCGGLIGLALAERLHRATRARRRVGEQVRP